MSITFTVGKRQALVPLDSATSADCLGEDCADGVSFCPRHHPHVYPDVVARHRLEDVAA